MSAPKLPVVLTPRAEEDVRDILVYTEQEWGERQRTIYQGVLTRALETLSANPRIGRRREDLAASVRRYVVRRHAILYRIEPEEIRVLRIVSNRMDFASLLVMG
jgi:toxin ParE1/3/4